MTRHPFAPPSTLPAQTRLGALLLVVALVVALLLSQTLGLVHAVVHGQVAGQVASLVAAQAQVQTPMQAPDRLQASSVAPQKSLLSALFAAHASNADCRLYDQASHGSAPPQVGCLALPIVLPSFAVAIFAGKALARWAALFDARGPPVTR